MECLQKFEVQYITTRDFAKTDSADQAKNLKFYFRIIISINILKPYNEFTSTFSKVFQTLKINNKTRYM